MRPRSDASAVETWKLSMLSKLDEKTSECQQGWDVGFAKIRGQLVSFTGLSEEDVDRRYKEIGSDGAAEFRDSYRKFVSDVAGSLSQNPASPRPQGWSKRDLVATAKVEPETLTEARFKLSFELRIGHETDGGFVHGDLRSQ